MLRPAEEQDEGDGREQHAYQDHVKIEIIAQPGADTGDTLVLHVAVQPAARLFLLNRRFDVLGLDPFRTAQDVEDATDVGHRGDTVPTGAFQQEFGHPFLDAFHDFLAAGLAQIMGFQILQIGLHLCGGVFLEREGIASDAHFFNLFHRLSVSMLNTISCHAASISASWARPLSVIS